MIDDFFSSKTYPKFYLKTEKKEIFALGKKEKKENFLVGYIPFSYKELESSWNFFYTPLNYSIGTPKNLKTEKIFISAPLRYKHDLSFTSFEKKLAIIKESIHQNQIQKAILKRETLFSFQNKIDLKSFFLKFCAINPNVFPFIYQENEDSFFFGGTPERLFSREKLLLKTMALAGTSTVDQFEKNGFFFDEKIRLEFQIVLDEIAKTLASFSHEVFLNPVEIKQYQKLVHMHCLIEAKLKNAEDYTLIEKLHPTAAIIGHPKKASLNLISQLEEKKRHHYASCLGYIQEDEADILVGIRSSIIEGNLLRAFAGVGIVKKSDPFKEWQELNLKIKPMKIWGSL